MVKSPGGGGGGEYRLAHGLHDVFQTSATASKRLRIQPKSCILLQSFEATCVRNLLIVKNLEHEKISIVVPRERRKIVLSVPYILKIMSRLL